MTEPEPLLRAWAPTTKASALVYDGDAPEDDLAEEFHEASKLCESFGHRQTRAYLLDRMIGLRHSTSRAAKRYYSRPSVELPAPELPTGSFADIIEERQSRRVYGAHPVALRDLSSLLHASYGVTHQLDPDAPLGTPPFLRTVPSGGGLYPLDLYVFAFDVDGLEPGLYHFDPPRHRLETLRLDEPGPLRQAVAETTMYDEAMTSGSLLIVVAAMFWRTRFKYGLRGYRFALIEAGHVVQNALLTATALELASVPIGGFFDRKLEQVIGLDGVNESVVYSLAVGSP